MVRKFAPVVAALAVGLMAPASISRADEIRTCTLIGCESGVTVDVRSYRLEHPEVTRLVVCVDRHCEVRRWKRDGVATDEVQVRTAADRERSVTVKVVAYDRRGHRRLRKVRTTFLRKAQPNGPQCEPICFLAGMRVSRHGRLLQGFAQ